MPDPATVFAVGIVSFSVSAILARDKKSTALDMQTRLADIKSFLGELTADMETLTKENREGQYNFNISISDLGVKKPSEIINELEDLKDRWSVLDVQLDKYKISKPPGGLASFFIKRRKETERFMREIEVLVDDVHELRRDIQDSTQTLLRRIKQLHEDGESALLLESCGPDLTTPTAASFPSNVQNPSNTVHV